MMPRSLILFASAVTLTVALSAQQAPPTFRSSVNAVEVDVFVTDAAGNPVANLTRDDFEVREDKQLQQVTSFSLVDIPIEPPAPYVPGAPEPDVASNHSGEGRLYVIALDELCPPKSACASDDATQSAGSLALRARNFLHRFIEEHFEPNDIGIVVSVGRARAGDMQDFTSNRRLLLKAIDSYGGGFPEGDQVDVNPEFAVRSQARALRDLMESLEQIKGRRKAMIYVSHVVGESSVGAAATLGGADIFDVLDYKGGVRSLQFDDLRAAMTSAMRGGVAIYAVDPAGVDSSALGSEELDRMSSLRRLSEATGGFAVTNSNSFEAGFTRLVKENSTYYLLGYTSTNDKHDGRYRRLDVRVTRPGLSVRFRDGYIAPSKNEPAAPKAPPRTVLSAGVGESIKSPLANATVPMNVFAAAYRGPSKDANIVVSVELDANQLNLVDSGSSMNGVIEVAAVAVSAGGKATHGQHEQVTLALKPATWAAARRSGIRVVTGFALPPGRYQLRVAGGNVAAPQAGSVMYDLDVPDFSKPPLAISPLTITSRETGAALTIGSKTVKPVVPIAPVTTRDFQAGDTLSMYSEVYDNRTKDVHRLDFVAELRDHTGRAVGHAVTDTRQNGQPLQKFEATVPLDVPPGSYVLHVEARSTLAKQPPVSRDVPLRVR